MVRETQAGRTTWDIPAGHIQAGETPESAIHREVLEETGLRLPDDLVLHGIFWVKDQLVPTIHFLYGLEHDTDLTELLQPRASGIHAIGLHSRQEVRKLIEQAAYEHELARHRLMLFVQDHYPQTRIPAII